MKLKNALLICGLSLTTLLFGCGISSEPDSSDAEEKTEVVEQEETIVEDTNDKEPELIVESEPSETIESQDQDDTSASNEVAISDVISAYQEILNAAPAIDLESEELYDASMGYDENQEAFGDHYDSFVLADLNQDGVPELITKTVVNFRSTVVSVYTYVDGEAVLVANPMVEDASWTLDQNSSANGSYTMYVCENFHLHNVWRGTDPMGEAVEENTAYSLDGKALSVCNCVVYESEQTNYIENDLVLNVAENVDAMGWK